MKWINLENDTAEIWGNNIVLDCTTSGHYCIPLNSNKLEECAFVKNESIKDELIKIHKQFSHPSKAELSPIIFVIFREFSRLLRLDSKILVVV